ncbi:hypothetical protein WJX72_006240 [[Myrmecia] bisecta]|uniref:Uncharacterized protein n=1 Tax=[Myrmecia] bisecta TaxID=41462 RepID=A0AAW1P459_9CHLO
MEVQPGPQDLPPSSPASAAADARPASASPTPPPGRQARASALAAHKKVAGFIAASGKSIRELRNEVEGKSPTKRAPARRNPGTIISSGVPPAQSSTAAPPGSQGYVLPTRPASLPNGPAAPQQPPRPPAGAPAISPTAVSQSIQSITSSVPLVAAGHSQPRPPVVASAEAAAAGTAATAVAEDGKPKRRGGRIKGSKNKPKFDADGNPIKRPQRGAARPKRSVPRDSSEEDEPKRRGKAKVEEDLPEEMDYLHGCTKCRYLKGGCGACRDKPIMERPKSVRWRPEAGRPQKGIPDAPTFYPTPEEFADPLTYIDSIRPEGERCGIACVVPPKGWSPPFALEKGTNGLSAESFRFSIRKQLTSHLCMRLANTSRHNKKSAAGRYDAKKPDMPDDDTFEEHEEDDGEFGFVTLDRTHTLKSFAAYADWVKSCHFGISNAPAAASASQGESEAQASKRRRVAPEKREPSVDEIEAEFWRIVETPDEVVESLYGQDLDSGHHGSGLPLPPFRQKMLEQHLAKTGQAAKVDKDENSGEKRVMTEEDIAYSQHAWNINNLPRCKGSVLRYVIGEELITGVMVPWLYVGSCLSAFCWHVEDHALYSINYLHMGAPKVWYGVPAHSSEALEEAVKDALPHLFEAAPDLLYQLVTMLSPLQLQARGVPVHRVVHREGSFVITFPNAYHAGFNTGFNCAEAVNFGPPDWIPYGTDIIEKYRKDGKATTLSYDALLIALVKAARPVKERMDNSAKQAAVKAEAMEVDAKPEAAVKAEPASVKEEASAAGSGPADAEMAEAEAEVELELEVTAGAAGTAGAAANGSAKLVSVTISPTKPGARKRANASGKAAQDKAAAGHPAGAKAACASGKDGPRVGRTDDISFLDPIEVKDVPPVAVKLGVGELTLRLEEEDRRRAVGLQGAVLKQQRMHGATGAIGEDGLHTDCEDTDCEVCKCDLYLSAIISPACPGRTVCAEHAAALGVRTEQMIMLYRYTMEEMYGWVGEAKRCIPGCDQAVAQAKQRKCTHTSPNQRPAPQVKKLGPVYVMNRPRGRPKSSPTSRRGGKRGPKAGAAKAPPRSKSQDISEAPEDLIVDAAPQPAAAEAANPMPAAAAQPPAMATASAPAPAAAAPAVPAAPAAEAEPAASRRPVRVVPKRKGAEAPETAAKRPRRPKQAPGAKRGAAQPAGTASQGAAGQPGQGDAASQPASSLAALVPAVLQGGFASAWPAALPPPNMSPEYLAGMQQMLAALSDAPPDPSYSAPPNAQTVHAEPAGTPHAVPALPNQDMPAAGALSPPVPAASWDSRLHGSPARRQGQGEAVDQMPPESPPFDLDALLVDPSTHDPSGMHSVYV